MSLPNIRGLAAGRDLDPVDRTIIWFHGGSIPPGSRALSCILRPDFHLATRSETARAARHPIQGVEAHAAARSCNVNNGQSGRGDRW
jgi:hypothetical protein